MPWCLPFDLTVLLRSPQQGNGDGKDARIHCGEFACQAAKVVNLVPLFQIVPFKNQQVAWNQRVKDERIPLPPSQIFMDTSAFAGQVQRHRRVPESPLLVSPEEWSEAAHDDIGLDEVRRALATRTPWRSFIVERLAVSSSIGFFRSR
jgi:hypothetical protein